MSVYEIIHTKIVPPLFLIFFTSAGQIITLAGRNETISLSAITKHCLGNVQAWISLFAYVLWTFLSLKLSSKNVSGPALPSGFKPQFKGNGTFFFWSTLAVLIPVLSLRPDWAVDFHRNIPELFGAINILALLFCLWLLVKGKRFPEENPEDGAETEGSLIFDFYRGVELHPTLFGVSIKQHVISRFGVMGWLLLVLINLVAAMQLHGFNFPFLVSVIVQFGFVLKFFLFYESTGYIDSLDIAFDRAGYYLIWGSMVWMPGLYGLHAYYFVTNPPKTSLTFSLCCLVLGLGATVLEYRVDHEKYLVRNTKASTVILYGKPADVINAKYTDHNGKKRTSRLVASGFRGISRHPSYVFDLVINACMTAPGYNLGYIPYLHPAFMFVLLIHRIARDEQKCREKYGKFWELYCSKVPYKLIPWVF